MTVIEESIRGSFRKPLERVACRAFLGVDQLNLIDNAWNRINFDAVTYDLGKNFDITTNYRFDVPVSGLYLIKTSIRLVNASVVANKTYDVGIFVNNIEKSTVSHHSSGTSPLSLINTDSLYLEKEDYLDIEVYPEGIGGNTVDVDGIALGVYTFVIVYLLTKEGIR